MKPRRPSAALAAVWLLLLTLVAFAPTTASAAGPTFPNLGCSTELLQGDWRLGPAQLPSRGIVGLELGGYHRFGRLTPAQFLDRYWNPTTRGGTGTWRYPPADGFVIGPDGQPIEAPLRLPRGDWIDRYGRETGGFLAPFASPYARRSIPPSSLDDDPPFDCDYHAYRVERAFAVDAGPVAPAFAQPGHGVQYRLDGALVPGAPEKLTVGWLVGAGYLEPIGTG